MPQMQNCERFHAVSSGTATIEISGTEPNVQLGDFVLIPHGTGHRAWGAEQAPTPDVFTLDPEYVNDDHAELHHGGDVTRAICGSVRFDHPGARHLIDSLPPLSHIEASRLMRADRMRATLEFIAEEAQNVRPGSDAVVSHLCDIVVIQAILAWISRDPEAHSGWLGALHDEQIGATIASIHADPEQDWTVAALADRAEASRSAFSSRFTRLVDEPAMRYVTRWRMYLALYLLEHGDASVAAVAEGVGYGSEAAFSQAFKRATGSTPGGARQEGTDWEAAPSLV